MSAGCEHLYTHDHDREPGRWCCCCPFPASKRQFAALAVSPRNRPGVQAERGHTQSAAATAQRHPLPPEPARSPSAYR